MCKEEDIPCSCINSRELQQDRAGRSLLSPPKKAKRWKPAWPLGRRHREGCRARTGTAPSFPSRLSPQEVQGHPRSPGREQGQLSHKQSIGS